MFTDDEFLNQNDKKRLENLFDEIRIRELPDSIFNTFKVISPFDKIFIYDQIKSMKNSDKSKVKNLIRQLNYTLNYKLEDFQVVLNIIEPIIKNKQLKFLIDRKTPTGMGIPCSTLNYAMYYYLRDGFRGTLKYHIGIGADIDKAMRETAKFIFNTLKYQIVKYLSVFNLIYMYIESTRLNKDIDEVTGINILLKKLEHNALTDEGKIASDYGVPTKVVEYFDNKEKSNEILKSFDEYEHSMFKRVQKIVEK